MQHPKRPGNEMKAYKRMVRACEGNVLVEKAVADVLRVPIIVCNLSKKLDLYYHGANENLPLPWPRHHMPASYEISNTSKNK